jgi:hypothetical protein
MKSRIQVAGACAVLAAAAAALQAEVKINENLSIDGYATGAGVVTEGTAESNGEFFNSGRVYDSALVGLNGTYKSLSARVSLLSVIGSDEADKFDSGLLDAYLTYKVGNLSITGGKYLGWLGFESFHSVNNAFISFSEVYYASPYSTGAKLDYAGEGFSTGISVRDTQAGPGGNFFDGDGEFSDDIGFEAYAMLTSIENLTLFAGAGYEDVDDAGVGGISTFDLWANYKFSDSFSVAAEIATLEEFTKYGWLLQATYMVTEPLALSGRLTGADGDNGLADSIGYGVASTYTITPNFQLKGEATLTENATGFGGEDVFSYAIQGIFKF